MDAQIYRKKLTVLFAVTQTIFYRIRQQSLVNVYIVTSHMSAPTDTAQRKTRLNTHQVSQQNSDIVANNSQKHRNTFRTFHN